MTSDKLPPCPVPGCGAEVYEASIYDGDIETICCHGAPLHPMRVHEFIMDRDEYRALCELVEAGRKWEEREAKDVYDK